jgi:hypothetical protein
MLDDRILVVAGGDVDRLVGDGFLEHQPIAAVDRRAPADKAEISNSRSGPIARPSLGTAACVAGEGSGSRGTPRLLRIASHNKRKKKANEAFLWYRHQPPILSMFHDFRALGFVIACA